MAVYKVTFEAGNDESLEIWPPNGKLLTKSGFGEVQADIQMQSAPFQDGSTFIDSLLEVRELTLEVLITADNPQELEEKKRKFSKVFNPKLGEGILTVENMDTGTQREITAVSEIAPEYPGGEAQGRTYQQTLIMLSCPDPAWKDTENSIQPLGLIEGGLTFPLMFNSEEAFDSVFVERGEETVIENNGDIPAPVLLEFQGPAENPIITNQTTENYIKVETILEDNEKLIINTAFGEKSVIFVDENGDRESAFSLIDLDSVFWQLQPGQNVISFDSDIDKEEARVLMKYRNRYVGI